ncbi:MAG: N-6 DNA methylase, partial [Lachnospiraceae bacterium]|nr:N-6 DNA methylase [Lachnospiraceae bacterium]
MYISDISQDILTVDDVCKALSISRATVKNWIRLEKIIPDIDDQLFSREYIEGFAAALQSDENTMLKRRRNKKSATGKALYKDYVRTADSQKLVSELLELDIIKNEKELLIVLANFAVQLYYQSKGISCSENDVLCDFLSQSHGDDFHILIDDLIGKYDVDSASMEKLQPVLTKKMHFVRGEDSLGFVYISLRDIGRRKSAGVYYTPEKIVNELIECLYENDENLKLRKICDPCCGTGNFLLSLGARGMDYENLYGQDSDPVSVCLARINIALMSPEMSAADICSRIRIGNTYFDTFAQKFDVILGNPPWGGELSEEEALRCRSLFKTAAGKSMASCDLFIEKSLTMLCNHGVLAFVLPEAIMSVAAHSEVRRLLTASCSFRFVSYLGNVFSGVQCPSILLGVTLSDRQTVVGCKVTAGKKQFTIMQPRCTDGGALSLNVSEEEYECLNAISGIENAAYLKGNARFALGIVTGNNKRYITDQKYDDNEIILRGSDIQRYSITKSGNYICFMPESFQQAAPTEMYRAKEKLLYRFISEVPVFAYDDQQTLSLNSCN